MRTFGWLNFAHHLLGGVVLLTVFFAALVASVPKQHGFHLRNTSWYHTFLYTELPMAAVLLVFGLYVVLRRENRSSLPTPA